MTPGCVEGPDHCSDIEVKPEFSDRRVGLVEMGYGERMYSWAMTWTPKVGKPWATPLGWKIRREGQTEPEPPSG